MREHPLLKRLLCAALAITLLESAILPTAAADTTEMSLADGAAFGSGFTAEAAADVKLSWVNDSLSYETVQSMVNRQVLHPQKTGWAELDALLADFQEAAGGDTCYQLWYMYDWLVKMVSYSWAGYGYTSASVTSYNSITYDYLQYLHHDGLTKTVPDDMANRTYHILTAKRGVCYDYAIAFAVMARYIGIESYVHTGYFSFETGGGGHHGWTILVLDGKNYIFDPQRDARNYQYNRRNGFYFGIPSDSGYRYYPDSACAGRDASMLPITTGITVSAMASRSGAVSGTGLHDLRATVTLAATPNPGKQFAGWYDEDYALISTQPTLSFTAARDRAVYALFSGDRFCDITDSHWYKDTVMEAAKLGLVTGMTAITFEGQKDFDRSMAVTMLSRIDKSDVSAAPGSGFSDVPAGSWYENYVNWAYHNGVTDGTGDGQFSPRSSITREEFIVMAVRYAEHYRKCQLPSGMLAYKDAHKLTDYALEPAKKAQAMGLIQGDDLGNLNPLEPISRAEGTAILLRLVHFLERPSAA